VQFQKSVASFLIFVGLLLFLTLQQPATAASPDPIIMGSGSNESEVTLEKVASTNVITLGEVVRYTITIKNNSTETIEPQLTDVLPVGLILKPESISKTVGAIVAEAKKNTVSWSGNLAKGEQAVIYYAAVPPSVSTADQKLVNVATLQVGSTVLKAEATITTFRPSAGLWDAFIHLIAMWLYYLNLLLEKANIPYPFGFAIILFTILIRVVTYPLNMQQIKSAKAMQDLQPQMKVLQDKYKNDREAMAMAQMALYKEKGISPLAGCFPMLIQMPVWIALYWSLIQLSNDGVMSEGFFWIPSLAGPVDYYSGGLGWLWPLPPSIGWGAAIAYLVLPVLLIVSQLYMQEMMTPHSDDPQQQSMQSMMRIMPFMFGYFALIVPSGLTLYWFTSNVLMMAQQYFTQSPISQPNLIKANEVATDPKPPLNAEWAISDDDNLNLEKGKNVRTKRKPKRNR